MPQKFSACEREQPGSGDFVDTGASERQIIDAEAGCVLFVSGAEALSGAGRDTDDAETGAALGSVRRVDENRKMLPGCLVSMQPNSKGVGGGGGHPAPPSPEQPLGTQLRRRGRDRASGELVRSSTDPQGIAADDGVCIGIVRCNLQRPGLSGASGLDHRDLISTGPLVRA